MEGSTAETKARWLDSLRRKSRVGGSELTLARWMWMELETVIKMTRAFFGLTIIWLSSFHRDAYPLGTLFRALCDFYYDGQSEKER